MSTKSWYKSKTNWLNIGAAVTTILAATAVILPSFQGLMSLTTYIIISGIVNFANIVLRNYFTETAIK